MFVVWTLPLFLIVRVHVPALNVTVSVLNSCGISLFPNIPFVTGTCLSVSPSVFHFRVMVLGYSFCHKFCVCDACKFS